MRKKILIIIGGIVFVVAILFVAIFDHWFLKSSQPTQQKESNELSASLDDCLKFLPDNPGDAYKCYVNLAKEYKNNDICLIFPSQIEGGGLWNNSCNTACSFSLAEATQDISVCDSIKYIEEANKCYCYYKAGVSFENLPNINYQGENKTCVEAYGGNFFKGDGYGFLSLCYKVIAI
ncbi:hypothetical protein KKC00_01895, partial [Patescibacteria group bacterium]|nr:hypothetical protein [Patescibacteria group bacterium]